MKRCPKCNGTIRRVGKREKPFFCPDCKEWFSTDEVTIKQTNGDRIRSMSDEKLAATFAFSYCPTKFSGAWKCIAKDESCRKCWLAWLKQEAAE